MKLNKPKNSLIVHTGLNKKLIEQINNSDVNFIEKSFSDCYNIDAKFSDNKINATYFTFILNIFEELCIKYKLPFNALPPRIRCYNPQDLINKNNTNAFCITDTKKVLINEPPFEIRSIFIKKEKSILKSSQNIYKLYKNNLSSSGHFLSQGIHEWCHNIHIDKILKTYGYEGESKDLQNYYNKNLKFHPKGLNMIYNLSKPINEFHKKREITKYLGEYASNSTMEFFAEFLTKLITDSINSETLLPTYNPLDKLNKYSTNLQNFFNSIFKLS